MSGYVEPGWYPAPDAAELLRYWDGEMWTESARPAPSAAARTGQRKMPALMKLRKVKRVIAELDPGEQVEAGFTSGFIRDTYVIATTNRVMIIKARGFGSAVESISYDQIRSIRAPTLHRAEIEAGGKTFRHSTISSSGVHPFVNYVEQRLGASIAVDLASLPAPEADNPSTGNAPVDNGTDDDRSVIDRLARLQQLYAEGVLSEQEYSAAKDRLMAD